ncbi:MAG TPA: glycoside hydrolase [Cyanobacteria bacterium UBA8803]|nr:glycoside hydrolase [Cyanobacteria bacterium UBA9273]HBL57649.1 glycoside hydrolase [Cyanobacteria bacterium UBA8803]
MTSAAELPASQAAAMDAIAELKDDAGIVYDPLRTATGVYITVHGHFYQPPRENPYLDTIERQPSAAPFHDWNERIHYECYRPNAFARVVNGCGEVVEIVNNYEYLSFNIGPTLMSWLERHDLEVYQRILDADRKSCDRLNGHGNAIAQVYNHIILPLANERDKYTQIRWGKAEFRSRFGRDPEGMWLAETAVDYATLEALVAEGIKFTILAPSQAERCRPIPTENDSDPQWHEVGGSQIDPTRPYRCFLANGEFIDIFFYDGPISRDMGFNDVLNSSERFVGRLGLAVRGDHRKSQLISVATDGETFGHHKRHTEMCIAHAFTQDFPYRHWTVTNFGHYLSISPPTWEVILKPVTAWSCAHGVNRWQEDCGCGGGGGWHQKWRRPLRDALNWLRDRLIEVYEEVGSEFFRDPWAARDDYIKVILDRSAENVENFLDRHVIRSLNPTEQIDLLRLLEMQRHALLMYTSCGWFFDEISRPEGVQILRYAARAVELAAEVAGVQLEQEFRDRLELAPSNVDFFKTGAEVYRHLVLSAQISFKQVAAHYAISSLFTSYAQQEQAYCYEAHQLDYQLQRLGALTLGVGQLRLISAITWESTHLVFAVLHLGGWDFHCCIQPFTGRRAYSTLKDKLFEALKQASAAHAILAMTQLFNNDSFSLQNLFAEERHRIMQLLSQETLSRLNQLYTQMYRDNYGVLMAFQRDELPVPQELQVAAEIALSNRCLHYIRVLDSENSDPQMVLSHVAELEAIATEANHLRCHLNILNAKPILEKLIWRSLWQVLNDANPEALAGDLHRIERLIELGNQLHLGLSLDRCQELYFNYLHSYIDPLYRQGMSSESLSEENDKGNGAQWPAKTCWDTLQLRHLLQFGQKLRVEVSPWLSQL